MNSYIETLNTIAADAQTGKNWTQDMQSAWEKHAAEKVDTQILAEKLAKMYAAMADVMAYTKSEITDAGALLFDRDEALYDKTCNHKIHEFYFE